MMEILTEFSHLFRVVNVFHVKVKDYYIIITLPFVDRH